MFYISKYNFEVNQNISVLNDQMKKSIVGVHDFESENIFGISTPYFGQFNYDEFMNESVKYKIQNTEESEDIFHNMKINVNLS